MNGKLWTNHQLRLLRDNYADMSNADIAKLIGRTKDSVENKACQLKLRKSKAYMQSLPQKSNLLKYGKKYRFAKGHTPANKGLKMTEWMQLEMIERTKKTRFKKGQLPHNSLPDCTETIRTDKRTGKKYVMIKLPGVRKLVYKHIWVWETNTGKKKPKGYNIIFKDGNNMNITFDNLECISNAELMRRNTIHRYPEEMKRQMKKLARLKKVIKKVEK